MTKATFYNSVSISSLRKPFGLNVILIDSLK